MLESILYLAKVHSPFSQGDKAILIAFFFFSQMDHMFIILHFAFSPLYLIGRRSGVLLVKILELHEECAIQVAMCEHLAGLQANSSSQGEAPRTILKVLFTKETAHHLKGHPQDIILIYPPW